MRRVLLGLTPVALAACYYTNSPSTPVTRADSIDCKGESYVDVNNSTPKSVDVYATLKGAPVFLGSVSPGQSRLSLMGTQLEHADGFLYAVVDGKTNSSGVRLARRCDRAGEH